METQCKTEDYCEAEQIDITKEFSDIINSISLLKKNLSQVQQNIRTLERNVKLKYNKLKNKKLPPKTKSPSGFAKPMKISNDLCCFLNKEEGTELARTDVTKALIKYIEQHQLQDTTNKKIINPDTKLKYLLGLNDDDSSTPTITYFSIQKYMNKHFVNTKTSKKLFNNE